MPARARPARAAAARNFGVVDPPLCYQVLDHTYIYVEIGVTSSEWRSLALARSSALAAYVRVPPV